MVRVILVLVWTSMLLEGISVAEGKDFGLGIIVGEPTGISLKSWMRESTALDGAIGWSTRHRDFLYVHGDYLVHNFAWLEVETGKLPFYYGVGGRIKLRDDDSTVGVRIPVGLAYLFAKVPLDVFFELVPSLDLVPDTAFRLDGAIGIRYFLGGS